MKRVLVLSLILFLCMVFIAWGNSKNPSNKSNVCIVLKGGKLIDGNGGPPVENSILVIKGGRIQDVGKGDPLKDISILRHKSNIVSVYKGGTKVPRLNLD